MVGVNAGVRMMMAVIGHGVTSCLCVYFGVWREHKQCKDESKNVNVL